MLIDLVDALPFLLAALLGIGLLFLNLNVIKDDRTAVVISVFCLVVATIGSVSLLWYSPPTTVTFDGLMNVLTATLGAIYIVKILVMVFILRRETGRWTNELNKT